MGAATHVVWDAFTHEVGWFVERSSFLQMKLFTMDGHHFRMYRLFWHISTWTGLFVLCRAYLQTLKKWTGSTQVFVPDERRKYALWLVILSLPLLGVLPLLFWQIARKGPSLAGTLRSLTTSAAVYLVAVSVLLIAIGAGLRIRDRPRE
jgi:hypothetical protein